MEEGRKEERKEERNEGRKEGNIWKKERKKERKVQQTATGEWRMCRPITVGTLHTHAGLNRGDTGRTECLGDSQMCRSFKAAV